MLRLPVGGFRRLFLMVPRLRGLPSGLELLSLGVLLPEEALETLLFSRTMEFARGVRSPEEEATLLEGEARRGLAGPMRVFRRPVSMLSVSTQDLSSGSDFTGCSETREERGVAFFLLLSNMFSVRLLQSIGLELAVAEFLKMDLGNERDILLVYHLSIMCGIYHR